MAKHAVPMSDNANDELYGLLLEVAKEAPIGTVANCIEVLATVLNKRLHDEDDKKQPDVCWRVGPQGTHCTLPEGHASYHLSQGPLGPDDVSGWPQV